MPRREDGSLTVLNADFDKIPEPPRALGRHGRALWNDIQAEYRIEDRGGAELLCQAAAAIDLAEDLTARIAEDGAVVYVRGTPRAHPGLRDVLQARALVCRILERLGLNVEAIKPHGRPPGPQGWVRDRGD
jgi:hypothetical protein